jgi:hypothetical protein
MMFANASLSSMNKVFPTRLPVCSWLVDLDPLRYRPEDRRLSDKVFPTRLPVCSWLVDLDPLRCRPEDRRLSVLQNDQLRQHAKNPGWLCTDSMFAGPLIIPVVAHGSASRHTSADIILSLSRDRSLDFSFAFPTLQVAFLCGPSISSCHSLSITWISTTYVRTCLRQPCISWNPWRFNIAHSTPPPFMHTVI